MTQRVALSDTSALQSSQAREEALSAKLEEMFDQRPPLQTPASADAASYWCGANAGWDAAVRSTLSSLKTEKDR